MKVFILSLLFSLNLLAVVPANTKTTTATAGAVTGTGKSHNFEDLLVNGKYHFAEEAVSTVEADKVFDSLIGVRNDFKDRLEDSATSK
jgi:mRNA-degrading endonuclease toxin of MazEF toxin-antitoxin module